MALRKKTAASATKRSNSNSNMLSQLGLLDMPGLDDDDGYDEAGSDNDDDLEAELEAVLSGKVQPRRTKEPKKKLDMMNIEMMASQAMKDITSDNDEDDGDISNEDELLEELSGITGGQPSTTVHLTREPSPPVPLPPKVQSLNSGSSPRVITGFGVSPATVGLQGILEDRLKSYKMAESAAKALGETTKARRFNRGAKTLETLIKEAKAGRVVSEEDIPPSVSIPKANTPVVNMVANEIQPTVLPPSPTSPVASPVAFPELTPAEPPSMPRRTPSQKRTDNTMAMLTTRRDQYKMAALTAKKSQDMSNAIKYVKISKQFDSVIEALTSGKPIDLSKMPPPPPGFLLQNALQPQRDAPPVPTHLVPPPVPQHQLKPVPETIKEEEQPQIEIPDEPEDPNLFNAPPPPSTILEALNQRLEKYKITLTAAQTENNTSRAKRLARIVKQYEDAIKTFKSGKPVDYDSLPAPPGFGTIPGVGMAAANTTNQQPLSAQPKVAPESPIISPTQKKAESKNVTPKATVAPNPPLKPTGRSPNSVLDKQLTFLNERHRLFREAALESKKNNDISQAKEYLRMAKGIEPMIEATRCGLPIDATSVPTPPQLMEDFAVVDKSECLPEDWVGDKEELFRNLERDLTRQLEICERNAEHFKSLGDVSSINKFQKLCEDTKRDLNVVHSLWSKGSKLPKFHYETRIFTLVQCHSHLGDNELELTVMRGINLPGKPTELDSYVRIEFPYPTEGPQRQKTYTIKDTNNPEFNQSYKFEMNRKSRSLARIFKRHPIKLEVWSKGGFLRSDSMIGTAQVRLEALEKKCIIHDSFDLLDGRKACGGKLEVKVCIREPLFAKHVEEVKERWLVIGS